jgi:hypothetical protein
MGDKKPEDTVEIMWKYRAEGQKKKEERQTMRIEVKDDPRHKEEPPIIQIKTKDDEQEEG